jgi:hypothetical protein
MMAYLLAVNLVFTPGLVRPLSTAQVCATKWGLDRRFVTVSMKQYVAGLYGVPWENRRQYEFDHLIPRELAGADDVRNIWPQLLAEAREKDKLENALHRQVCAGLVTLRAAQAQMKAWR